MDSQVLAIVLLSPINSDGTSKYSEIVSVPFHPDFIRSTIKTKISLKIVPFRTRRVYLGVSFHPNLTSGRSTIRFHGF